MNTIIFPLLVLALIFGIIYIFLVRKKKPHFFEPLSHSSRLLLENEVLYYNQLDDANKKVFEERMQLFLSKTRITGVNSIVEEIDKLLIGASAIIPIFGFPGWEYTNLNEVLLYPDAFNESFHQQGEDRNTLGLVGTGAFQNIMILSKQQLREGYRNRESRSNTGIHEFVHLVDKADGEVNGVPEGILSRKFTLSWYNLMQFEIKQILESNSDINPYGATNEGEFFAVVAEYFFKQPDLLETNHPELYNMMVTIFRQQPNRRPGKIIGTNSE